MPPPELCQGLIYLSYITFMYLFFYQKRKSIFRWHQPTLGNLFCLLIIVEAFLLLSEYFRWFPFNEKKGWTPLVAIAAILITVIIGVSWFIHSILRHRYFQFTLIDLVVLTIAVAIPFSWLGVESAAAKKQRKNVETIYVLNGNVGYRRFSCFTPHPYPQWLLDVLGVDYFDDVVNVQLRGCDDADKGLKCISQFERLETLDLEKSRFKEETLINIGRLAELRVLNLKDTPTTDNILKFIADLSHLQELNLESTQITNDGMKSITDLTQLTKLNLNGTNISDNGLKDFKRLSHLQHLSLIETQVSEGGREALSQSIPQCKIYLNIWEQYSDPN